MKIFGKKFPKGNMLLYISFTAISLCFLLMVSTLRAERKNDMSQRTLYSRHYESFSIVDSDDEHLWEEVMPELGSRNNNFAIYVPMKDEKIILRGIYVKGKVATPPMIRGEYFDASTSWTDEPKIVLGKDLEKDTYVKNGNMYYKYSSIEFLVIGVMGTEEDSKLNNMCILDFKSAVGINGINTAYVLDTKRASKLYDVANDIYNLFPMSASVMIRLTGGDDVSFTARFLSPDTIMDTLYVMILISFALSTVIVTFIWLSLRKQLFFAWKLCGYKKSSIRIEISKRFYLTTGISFITGMILISVISKASSVIDVIFMDVVQAFSMTVGLGTVILFVCYVTGKRLQNIY